MATASVACIDLEQYVRGPVIWLFQALLRLKELPGVEIWGAWIGGC